MAQKTITILNSVGSYMGITRNASRPGPLHTCGVAAISITQKAYRRVEDLPGPIGSITQKIAPFVSPILYIIQSHWLASLSFTDYQILAIENVIETVFPPSSHVFDKIDTLVYFSETLPEKFDYAVDKFPVMIRQVPILNWALAQLILLLSFLLSILTDWGFDGAKEKEIMIDMNSHDDHVNEPSFEPDEDRDNEGNTGQFGSTGETETGETETEDTADLNAETVTKESIAHDVDNHARDKPVDGADEEVKEMEKQEENEVGKNGGKTYKEVVEMGGKNETKTYKEVVKMGGNKRENRKDEKEYENGGKIVEEISEENQNQDQDQNQKKSMHVSSKDEKKADGCSSTDEEDQVLELFSAGWHMR